MNARQIVIKEINARLNECTSSEKPGLLIAHQFMQTVLTCDAKSVDAIDGGAFDRLVCEELKKILKEESGQLSAEQKQFYDLIYACLIATKAYCLGPIQPDEKPEAKSREDKTRNPDLVYLSEGPPLNINEVPLPIPSDYKHPKTQQCLAARDLNYLANTVSQRKSTTVFIHEALSEAQQNNIRLSDEVFALTMLLLMVFVVCEVLLIPLMVENLPRWLNVAILTMANIVAVLGTLFAGHVYSESRVIAAGNHIPQETPRVVEELLTSIATQLGIFSRIPGISEPKKHVVPAAARFGVVF